MIRSSTLRASRFQNHFLGEAHCYQFAGARNCLLGGPRSVYQWLRLRGAILGMGPEQFLGSPSQDRLRRPHVELSHLGFALAAFLNRQPAYVGARFQLLRDLPALSRVSSEDPLIITRPGYMTKIVSWEYPPLPKADLQQARDVIALLRSQPPFQDGRFRVIEAY